MATAATRQALIRFGKPTKPLSTHVTWSRKTGLPVPPTNIVTREFAPCRLEDHYHHTLKDDLMYMTYKHQLKDEQPKQREIRLAFNEQDPYSKFRANHPVGGSQVWRKPAPPCEADNVVRLERVQLHMMVKESVQNKSALLSALMMLKALTGETFQGGGHHAVEGLQLVRGRKNVGGWLRSGIPVGVKVDLRGQAMYDFIGSLVEFVLPRLREFNGVVLPPASSSVKTPSSVAGVVSFGLPSNAMMFFPQIEVNVDAYPKLYGMHIHFITNATGVGAQDKARALVSGFQIPFVRK